MLINEAKLTNSKIGFDTRFNKALAAVDDPLRMVALEVPSNHPVEEYPFLWDVPGFSEWIDGRKLMGRVAEKITIANKDWESSIKLTRNDILDDRLGLLGAQVDELARAAGLHYGERALEALVNGFVTTSEFGAAYDGLSFFNTAHTYADGTTYSNRTAAALSHTAVRTARATMWKYKNEHGKPRGIVGRTLIVGPDNEATALEIADALIIPGPSAESISNVMRGKFEVVVSPLLQGSYANHWFLADLSRSVKPLLTQIREAISTAMLPASGNPADFSQSERLFMYKDMLYGAQGRHNTGYGLPQLIYGSNN